MTIFAREVELYPARDGWRWRKWAPNGRVTAESGEAYTRKSDGYEAAERENPDTPIVIRDARGNKVVA